MPNPQGPGRLVREGYDLLWQQSHYSQREVVAKLATLQCQVSPASFNNILRYRNIGAALLASVAVAMQQLVWLELGFRWTPEGFEKQSPPDWNPEIVPSTDEQADDGFIFHADGRLPIGRKVDFFSRATHDVMELGLSLNTFSNYFFSRNEQEFRRPVEQLLARGINYQCYVLDPRCNEAHLYFKDRARSLPDDGRGPEKIRGALVRLHRIRERFLEDNLPGKFELYLYKHVPSAYYMVVDGLQSAGSMLVSHYLYGQLNADCPVLEIHRPQQRPLFQRYMQSFKLLIQDAQPVPVSLTELA